MKNLFLICLTTLLILFGFESKSQCNIIVNSSNGYNVNITINITSINPTANGCGLGYCMCGYQYNYTLAYNISITGAGAPSNMWTLQGRVTDDNGNSTFNLPTNGGVSNVTSQNTSTSATNCGTVTKEYFHPTVYIIIQGPGIPYQTIPVICGAMPIELVYFKGFNYNDGVLLEWCTALEKDNSHFVIERSSDAMKWETIHYAKGSGNSNNMINYYYFDEFPLVYNYYRLTQYDFNGDNSQSQIINVNCMDNVKTCVYPNPTNNSLINVEVLSKSESNIEILVYDVLCQLVEKTTIKKEKTELSYELKLPKTNEVYNLIIIQDNIILGEYKVVSY